MVTAGNLAMLLGKMGKFEEAKEIYEDVLEGYDKVNRAIDVMM